MKAAAIGVAVGALIVLAGSPAAAQATKVGFAMGAAVPTGGIALHDPTLAVSVWAAGSIHGPYGWRAEVGRQRLQMPDQSKFRCAAAGIYCDANVVISSVAGGLQLEPHAERQFAPFGYVTGGLYRSSASAEVLDTRDGSAQMSDSWRDNAFGVAVGGGLRVRLGGPWTARAELRYSGFNWKPGTVNWASIITPGLNVSVAF